VFENTFAAELATRIGTTVEVFTDNGMTDGILSNVTPDLVLVIEVTTGYENEKVYVSVDAINYARFPAAAV
jgi:DNA-binding MurR/RpiR family transcriptional regulator